MHFFCLAQSNKKLITVSGTVYDNTAQQPIEAVAVQSTMGNGTLTDANGKYSITVRLSDSIWFTMLGKSTQKYIVDTINTPDNFNISVLLNAAYLPEVRVRNKNYRIDSLMNRQDYAKVFNFKKPGISIVTPNSYVPGALTAGFDLESIINMFRFKRNRSITKLQNRLLEQEREKYVDFRFNKNFVRKLTKLQAPEIDTFMVRFRPDYDFLLTVNDLELGYAIQKNFQIYKAQKDKERFIYRRKRF
jgi:hypothetical protein